MEPLRDKTIAIVATLDTKAPETAYLKSRIEGHGFSTLILNTAILECRDPETPECQFLPDEIAREGGVDLQEIRLLCAEKGARNQGIRAMAEGAARILKKLYEEGRCLGAIGVGGAQGTEICTTAMRALPLGVPKLMVSTVASGKTPFGIYVGTRDLTIMHSVVDILGINSVSRRILANAAGAITGMCSTGPLEEGPGFPRIGITIYGQTTPSGLALKTELERRGFEVIAFHPNGTGGRAMEEMAVEHFLDGLLDLTPHEVTDELFGGIHAGSPERILAAGQSGIPRLLVPGAVDVITMAEPETIPETFRGQPRLSHNPHITLVRTSRDQMLQLARVLGERLNQSGGPVAVVIPRGGYSFYNRPGLIFYDPEADQAFVEALKGTLRKDIPVHELEGHINDPEFVKGLVPIFMDLLKQAGIQRKGAAL
jgi:uncharacterized protein (UPF0261 family)